MVNEYLFEVNPDQKDCEYDDKCEIWETNRTSCPRTKFCSLYETRKAQERAEKFRCAKISELLTDKEIFMT